MILAILYGIFSYSTYLFEYMLRYLMIRYMIQKIVNCAWSVSHLDNYVGIDLKTAFSRYCTEILALLPFTLPDEPLYLIYAINRVIQVRAGTLEANMKAFLHLWQEDAKKLHGNGITQPQGPSCQPVSDQTIPMDLNGRLEVESGDQPVSNHSEPMYQNLHPRNSYNTYHISEDDLQKIQVVNSHTLTNSSDIFSKLYAYEFETFPNVWERFPIQHTETKFLSLYVTVEFLLSFLPLLLWPEVEGFCSAFQGQVAFYMKFVVFCDSFLIA